MRLREVEGRNRVGSYLIHVEVEGNRGDAAHQDAAHQYEPERPAPRQPQELDANAAPAAMWLPRLSEFAGQQDNDAHAVARGKHHNESRKYALGAPVIERGETETSFVKAAENDRGYEIS